MNKQTEKKIDKLWSAYNDDIDEIAADVFEKQVRPYLQKHNLTFLAGNGTYIVCRENGEAIYHEDLPKWLYDILEQELPGLYGNTLGTVMRDFRPE